MLDGWLPSGAKYDHPDLGDDPEQDPYLQADLTVTLRISAVIEHHYPGHPWMVKVSHMKGIIQIGIPMLMGANNWYVIPLGELRSDPALKCVMRGCGEILERYRIPRQAFSRDHFLTALHKIPPALRGTHGHVPE